MQPFNNYIHPTAIIGPGVLFGKENWVGPYCIITGKTRIGDGNRFEAFVSIGTPPEHRSYWDKEYAGVRIGDGCTIREYVTINAGTVADTWLASNVTILRGSHVGHDAQVLSGANISCNVLIGGHTVIGEEANLGLGCIIHQRQGIARGCMIGMGAVITKKLVTEPYKTYIGNPARLLGDNTKHPSYTIFMQQHHGECAPE